MRRFRFTLTPAGDGFATADRRIAEAPGVDREAILHLQLMRDGTAMAVYRLSGDPRALEDALSGAPEVDRFHVFTPDGDRFHLHVTYQPDDPMLSLLELTDRHRIVIEPPIEFVDGGRSMRVTIGSLQEMVQRAADDFPAGVEVSVEQIGQYDPSQGGLLSSLTSRQREVLAVAVERGYYDIPRRATHEDLAAELGCSAGTVGEHLRKIESRVLSGLPGRQDKR